MVRRGHTILENNPIVLTRHKVTLLETTMATVGA